MDSSQSVLARLERAPVRSHHMPSVKDARSFIDELIAFLFPVRTSDVPFWATPADRLQKLKNKLREVLAPLGDRLEEHPAVIVEQFFDSLAGVYDELIRDAGTIERFDPAAESVEEVIVAYPGFYAIAVHRLAHELHRLKVRTLPRIMSEYAHAQTGIDIHPAATIGSSFFIDHGTGIVIGETTQIGNNVKLYQGVTLGALSVSKELAHTKRHPTIEENVIVYSGSTILGGETVIGHDSVIGGNVWLTESVSPFSVVYHKSEVHVRIGSPAQEPVDWVI